MGGLNFGQGDNQLPCFNTLSWCAASFKFLLTFFCEITPKGIVCGSVGGIGVLLSCVACNIRYSSFDIGQLRHLNEAVSCQCRSEISGVQIFRFVRGVYFAFKRRGLPERFTLPFGHHPDTVGFCVQIMHLGSFDDEPATVAIMDEYLKQNGYANDMNSQRLHHEIYLSDARKVVPEKWKTVIRHPIRKI